MKHQFNLFLIALTFFSRIPVPCKIDFRPELLNQANRYFTLVGWILGAIVAAIFYLATLLFDQNIAVFLALAFSLLLTGAFHEDGLADTFGGFYGGMDKEAKLRIMKDSRLGTYGAAALVFALLGKWLFLSESGTPLLAMLVAYPLSRCVASSFIFDMPYSQSSDGSKSKPLASQQTTAELLISLLTALPVFLFLSFEIALILLLILVILRFGLKFWMKKHIGGYSGDTLGATQQISELTIYAVLLATS